VAGLVLEHQVVVGMVVEEPQKPVPVVAALDIVIKHN
jgi:hypothetical protein